MNSKYINANNVSYIQVFDAHKGVYSYWHGYTEYIWMEADYFHFLWIFKTPILNYEKGYYRNSKRRYITNDTPFKINEKQHFVEKNFVWTRPFIQIFCGDKIIHTEFFMKFEDLEAHLKENYYNTKVRYDVEKKS